MRKIYLVLVVTLCFLTSCHNDIWNSINDLDSRVKILEELCKEMNTNINSLQVLIDAIQSGDYITNIVPITKGGEVIGYTITFKNHEPITIYNGEDGTTANTPNIGVAQDSDGFYYWTINGKWLLDENNNKIRVTG
ncbi:MAG: PL29 family lyase N-terminal domain-containing protein, partial [Bacteroidales bacterium]|nr:PL29 family lyase N-terminal domain-containing protein [Bacteroidales bacterium]